MKDMEIKLTQMILQGEHQGTGIELLGLEFSQDTVIKAATF